MEGCYADGSYIASDASDGAAEGGVSMTDTGVPAPDVRDSGASQPDADAAMEAGPMCEAPSVLCARTCVITDSDPAHCGGCGRACTTGVSNARATCVMGACDFECAAGFELVGATCEAKVPRAIGPMTSATVTSQRPTLEWELPMGVTTASVEVCRDRAMTASCVTLTAAGTRVRPTTALMPGVWFWRVRGRVGGAVGTRTSPVWWFRVGHADAPVDTFHGVELDVNGDGFGDVAVGAPGSSPGGRSNAGAIYLFLGNATGALSAPTQIVEGTNPGDGLGERLSAAGDVNGDGLADLLAARPGGIVELYLGRATGLEPVPTTTLTAAMPRHGFGASIAAAGDVDGDGFADAVIGAFSFDDFAVLPPGTVSIHRGSPTGLEATPAVLWTGDARADNFGWAVAGAGDVNGDRVADIAVSESDGRDTRGLKTGSAQLFLGRRAAAPLGVAQRTIYGSSMNSYMGGALLVSADANGDGYSDLIVSADAGDSPLGNGIPTLYQFSGSSSGLVATPRYSAGIEPSGNLADGRDGDQDGRTDVYWSTPYADNGTSRDAGMFVLLRAASATDALVPSREWLGTDEMQQFGTGIALTDFNGDGRVDLLASERTFGLPVAGRLMFFQGGPTAPAPSATRSYSGGIPGDRFGAALAY